MRQLKPRNPLACSPERPTDSGLGSREPPLPPLPSARPPATRSTQRALGPGQAGGAGTRREELTRLRGFEAPAGRARFSAAFPRACSPRLPEARGAGPRESAQSAGLAGLGQSQHQPPPAREAAAPAAATAQAAPLPRTPPPAPPPSRPAAAAELSPPLCSAPPPPPPPSPRPALSPEPPPSRRPAPLGPQPATGAGGGGDAGRRLLLPAISSLLPGSPRWLGAEGSGLEGRHVGECFRHRKSISARRGEAW